MRFMRVILGTAMLIAVVTALIATRQRTPSVATDSTPKKYSGTLSIAITGDHIPYQSIHESANNGASYNYTSFYQPILPLLASVDAVVCPIETPIAGKESVVGGFPSFNAPTSFAKDLHSIGCDSILLASDHIDDRGKQGIDATRKILQTIDFYAVHGANSTQQESDFIPIISNKDVRVAVLSFTDNRVPDSLPDYAVNSLHDTTKTSTLLQKAAATSDFVITHVHWTQEYRKAITPWQRSQVRQLSKYGADLVIGTGTHTLQTVEQLDGNDGGALVYYSLGNFLATQIDLEQRLGGVAVIHLEIKEGRIQRAMPQLAPIYTHYTWSALEEANGELLARKNIAIHPLHGADQLFKKARLLSDAELLISSITEQIGTQAGVKIIPADQPAPDQTLPPS